MIKILIILIASISPYFVLSQEVIKKTPTHKPPDKHTVFIDGALGSLKIMSQFNPNDIEKIEVIDSEEDNINKTPNNHYPKNISSFKNDDLTSQKDINIKHHLESNNDIYFDRYLIEGKSFKIYKEAIIEVEIVKPNSINKLTKKALNIWTLEKDERNSESYSTHRCIRF